ncbi:sugar ABC transporter ATP-binding protein [Bacillus sp. V33-4]|uniref:sugar ABC transporter ATP-binding protein n=1 Tax=Bacillus sp. V33-4 TaxID=2054169 RepID=UPI000C7653FD|nr:sugar ABC transporter ATP-binding protein [Bacillus sp. V33-4]PLR87127.1 sugar ABC transporter ATP-binding protein [Bacillus sp. V33-4]
MSKAILEMKGIKKIFGSVSVLKNVDFSLEKGEIHALVGGNGAGKSTLMKIMTGVYIADGGEIFIEGEQKKIQNSKDAKENGIAMIFQELSLVQTMTVAENIFLGEELTKSFLRDTETMNAKTNEILAELGISIDPNTPVNQLSVGMSQMIEIAKAISKNARILVLDEPTASLSDTETAQLFKIMRDLKSKGVSMVYISHRMNEILEIADSITILRDGALVTSDKIANMNLGKIISHLVGGSSQNKFEWVERAYDMNGDDLLALEHVHINDKIRDISFSLKKGEILGIAGLMGSGRTEILETLFGLRKKLGGTILFEGEPVQIKSISDAIKAGFALVPEDRRKQGLILDHSVKENAILPILNKLTKGKSKIVDENMANQLVEKDIGQFNIVTSSIDKRIGLLSGGNQQKVVIAKWLNMDPKVIMLDEPTAGVDIVAKSEIIQIIRRFADKGNGVIFVSSELTELLAVCDRIITIFDGDITREMVRKDIKSEEELQHAIQTS